MKTALSFILLACAAAVAGAEPVAEKAAAPAAMAWIPGGTFLMGTNDKESMANERPAHLVQVQDFWFRLSNTFLQFRYSQNARLCHSLQKLTFVQQTGNQRDGIAYKSVTFSGYPRLC